MLWKPNTVLFDRATQVIFQVTQAYVDLSVAIGIDLDQVAETKHLVLVAVADQDVEIGVDHGRFIATCDLEGCGADAISLVGFGF